MKKRQRFKQIQTIAILFAMAVKTTESNGHNFSEETSGYPWGSHHLQSKLKPLWLGIKK